MKALVIVDIQNDFLPGGALAVEQGHQILPKINELLKKPFDTIVATKDWHPPDHVSFASRHHLPIGTVIELPQTHAPQILWPNHCVQGTKGAEFAPGWDSSKVHQVIYKGSDKEIDSYSTFFDNDHRKETGLAQFLQEKGIDEVYMAGLATDYCVAYSVRDAVRLGFKTFVVIDACRGVDLKKGDVARAEQEMQALGAHLVTLDQLDF